MMVEGHEGLLLNPLSITIVGVAQSLSHIRLFVTPWTAARQTSPSITIARSLLKLMSIESVMASNHLILCCPLLLLPSVFPSIRVFSNESALHIRWPEYWHFSFSISPSHECSGVIFRIDWFDLLLSKGLSKVFSNTTVQKHQFFGIQPSLQSISHIHAASSVGKESACNAGDPGSIPGSGRSAGEGIGYPLQYSWVSLVAQLVKKVK